MTLTSDSTINDAIEQYLRHATRTESPQLSSARTQALALYKLSLTSRTNLSPKTPLRLFQPDTLISYLTLLQETRSIETEHLYSRALLDFLKYLNVHTTPPAITDQRLAELASEVTELRRQRAHLAPQIPFEAITKLLTFAATSQPAQKQNSNDRRYLQSLRDKSLVTVMAETGTRVSELCSLRRAHFIDTQIYIAPDLPLPLQDGTAKLLATYLREREELDNKQPASIQHLLPLYARHDKRAGARILALSRWTVANIVESWAKIALTQEEQNALRQSGQSISPHTLRHYFVITTLMQTDNIAVTTNLARHKDPATTKQYLATLNTIKP